MRLLAAFTLGIGTGAVLLAAVLYRALDKALD